MRSPPASLGDSFDLRVTLRHVKPDIWRAVRIPAHVTLAVLHETLQLAFGWQNSHLHEFVVGDVRFAAPEPHDERFYVNENAAPLGAIARIGTSFVYRYDYGDDWEHDVLVESAGRGGEENIVSTGGARACPPEDCGGPPGYEELLAVLADPTRGDYAEKKRWVGRAFDAEKFDAAAVNRKLATLAKRVARWKR